MPKIDYHILVETKYQIILCNVEGRTANNKIMNLTKTDLNAQQAKQIKQEFLSSLEQQETEFVLALEDKFDKQAALEISQSFNVSTKVINKHFTDYLDAVEETNGEKAYNASFWAEFEATAFSEALAHKCVVTDGRLLKASEGELERFSSFYVEEAKKHYQAMHDIVDELGPAYRDSADYAFAKLKFGRMAELYWMCERRLGRK